MLTMYVHTCRK